MQNVMRLLVNLLLYQYNENMYIIVWEKYYDCVNVI